MCKGLLLTSPNWEIRRYQGRGLGKALLVDAAMKAINAAPASFALLVDAKNDHAVNFYKRHGFRQLSGMPRILLLLKKCCLVRGIYDGFTVMGNFIDTYKDSYLIVKKYLNRMSEI